MRGQGGGVAQADLWVKAEPRRINNQVRRARGQRCVQLLENRAVLKKPQRATYSLIDVKYCNLDQVRRDGYPQKLRINPWITEPERGQSQQPGAVKFRYPDRRRTRRRFHADGFQGS